MEKRKIDIEQEAEKILNSVSEKVSVSPSPFFTSKVIGKIEQLEPERSISINWAYILKPGIAALLVFNLANYFLTADLNISEETQSDSEVLLAEYTYDSSTMAYYEDYLIEE